MLTLPRRERPLADMLRGPKLDAGTQLEMDSVVPLLIQMREHPAIALIATTGIFIPPHERIMLNVAHRGAQSNVFVCSRGTSKSSTIDVLYPGYMTLFYAKRKGILLSAAGFRGGQLLFNDMEKWAHGGWDSQQAGLEFVAQSSPNPKYITRLANYWIIKCDSMSEYSTYPTNDEEKLRGIRGHDLFLDEVNTMPETLVSVVSEPFLNVTGGFDSGGLDAASNRVFYTTTIDYSWRDFHSTAVSARASVENDFLALKASQLGDWASYTERAKDKLDQKSYVCFDYTDTIIRSEITNRDGERFAVNYPRHQFNPRLRFTEFEGGIPFTQRGADGVITQEGTPVMALKTYPIEVAKLEEKLRDGTGSVSRWLSEQKNVLDSAVGDVYPHHVVEKSANTGDRCVIPYEQTSDEWKTKYAADKRGYAPSLMWSCTDPVVIGVDYAGGQRDFSAFVVIRLGPLAKGEFDPITGLGRTDWSNVIWCEMHRLTSHKDVADKIREYAERYHLAFTTLPGEEDTWKLCRAIGLDMKGGGTGVRDELVLINEQVTPAGQFRIYDPLDKDERVLAFAKDPTAKPMLDAIQPSDSLNDKLVEFTLGQMQQGLLYLPKLWNDGGVGMDRRLKVGVGGTENLTHQLRKIQRAPTKNYHTYFMNGASTNAVENKKDLWAAFIYAAKQARAHVIRQRMIDDRPPPLGALRTVVGANRGTHGRAPGAKRG